MVKITTAVLKYFDEGVRWNEQLNITRVNNDSEFVQDCVHGVKFYQSLCNDRLNRISAIIMRSGIKGEF